MTKIKTVSSFLPNPTVKSIPFSFSDGIKHSCVPLSPLGEGVLWISSDRGDRRIFSGFEFFLLGFFWGRKKENLTSIFLGGLI